MSKPTVAKRAYWLRVSRVIGDGFSHAPMALGLLVLMWVVALGTTRIMSGPHGHLAQAVLADSSTSGDHIWSVLLSLLWAPNLVTLVWTTAALLIFGIYVERRMGSFRFMIVLVTGHVLGVLGSFAVTWFVRSTLPTWAEFLDNSGFGGPSLGVVAAAMACTASLETMWRRRWRLGGFILITTMVLFNGAITSVMMLFAMLSGLIMGQLLYRGRQVRLASTASIREGRILIALVCAAVAAGPPLAALSADADAPLSILGLLFTGVQDTTPEQIRVICDGANTANACAVAMLQLRAGVGAIFMACVPSLLLLVFCFGLRFGRRFAWWGTLVLQFGLIILAVVSYLKLRHSSIRHHWGTQPYTRLQLFVDLAIPVLVPLLVIVLLILTRKLFAIPGPRILYRGLILRLSVSVLAAAGVYVVGGLLIPNQFSPTATASRLMSDFPQRLVPLGLDLQIYPSFLPNDSGAIVLYEWVGVLFWLTVSGLLIASFRWPTVELTALGRDKARKLLQANEGGSLGWMGLWAGNSYWFSANQTGYVAYRVHSGIALTTGDPIGAADDRESILREFSEYCAIQGWVPCLYSVTPAMRDAAVGLSWHDVQIAEETVLDLGELAFTGKKFQDIRTAFNRAKREGVHTEWVNYPKAPLAITDQIRSISEDWVASQGLPELGFTLGGIDELNDPEVRCQLLLDDDRTLHAVASWLPIYTHGAITGWTLDFMRRRKTGFKLSMELLIAQAALDFQAEGFESASLSGAPLAQAPARPSEPFESTDAETSGGALERSLNWLGKTLEPVYGFRSLFAFKAKFHPRYVRLYLCFPDPAALPAIGQAIAKAYMLDASVARVLHQATRKIRS